MTDQKLPSKFKMIGVTEEQHRKLLDRKHTLRYKSMHELLEKEYITKIKEAVEE